MQKLWLCINWRKEIRRFILAGS